jgi:hypothetical protein
MMEAWVPLAGELKRIREEIVNALVFVWMNFGTRKVHAENFRKSRWISQILLSWTKSHKQHQRLWSIIGEIMHSGIQCTVK